MKESDYFPAEETPELQRLISIYQKIQRTGKVTYLEDFELADLADYYYSNEDDENLKQVIELADLLHPDSYEIVYIKTRFLMKKGKWKEANACIEKLEKTADTLSDDDFDEFSREELMIQANMLKGEAALLHHRPKEADGYFLQAFELIEDEEEKSFTAIHIAAMFLLQRIDKQTMEWIERSIQLMPDNQPALELLSQYYSDRKNTKKAEEVLDRLINEDPYSTYYWKLSGDTYLNSDNYEKAIEAYDFALAIDKDDHEALKKKAMAYINLENFEKAFQLLDGYIKKAPDDNNALALYSLCLSGNGQYEDASRILEHIMEATHCGKDDPNLNITELFHLIIRTYRMNKEYDKALQWIDKGIRKRFNKTFLHIMKGGVYMDMDKPKEAMKYFKKALSETDDPPAALFLIANEFFFFGNYAACERILIQVYEEDDDEDFHPIHAMLAFCYLNMGKHDKYIRFLKKACRTTPNDIQIIFSGIMDEGMTAEDFYQSEKKKYS